MSKFKFRKPETEPILRSLSHDLKEPIRSIRRRLFKIKEVFAGIDEKIEKRAIRCDDSIKSFGEIIRQFRLETRSTSVDFPEIEKFMAQSLAEPLGEFLDLVSELTSKRRSKLDEFASKDTKLLEGNCNRLRRRFEGILNYAKVQGELSVREFSVFKEIKRVLLELDALIYEKNASVTVEGTSSKIFGDQLKLAQVFQNLIENAVKYSGGEAAAVNIHVHTLTLNDLPKGEARRVRKSKSILEGEFVRVEVKDDGRGIASEDLEVIFKIFRRSFSGTKETLDDGSGIGLAIVKTVVDAHDGVVWAESKLDEGSVFKIFLPLIKKD